MRVPSVLGGREGVQYRKQITNVPHRRVLASRKAPKWVTGLYQSVSILRKVGAVYTSLHAFPTQAIEFCLGMSERCVQYRKQITNVPYRRVLASRKAPKWVTGLSECVNYQKSRGSLAMPLCMHSYSREA